MSSQHKALIGGAIGIGILFVVLAGALGPAFGMMYGDEVREITQDPNLEYSVNGYVDSNVTNINDDVTLEITDSDTGETITQTVANGSNATVTTNNGDIGVAVTDIESSGANATVEYTYSNTYTWNEGATGLFVLLPLLGMIVVLAALAAVAMRYLT